MPSAPTSQPSPTTYPPPRALDTISAILQYKDNQGVVGWRIDQPLGPSIAVGQSISLLNSSWNMEPVIVTTNQIKEMQRHWIIFDVSAPPLGPAIGSTLLVPRARVTLGIIGAIIHLVLGPWLPNTIPPPCSRPSRHHRPSPNHHRRSPSSAPPTDIDRAESLTTIDGLDF